MLRRMLAIARLRMRIGLHALRSGRGIAQALGNTVIAMMGALVSLALAVGFGVITFFAASSEDRTSLLVVYLVIFFSCAVFGILLPLVFSASGQSLDLRRLLVFPLSRGQLFGISLGSAFLGGEHLFYYPALAAMSLTGIVLPGRHVMAGLAIVLLFTTFVVVWSHALMLLLQGVMRRRRAREVVGVLLFLVIVVAGLVPSMLTNHDREGSFKSPETAERIRDAAARFAGHLPPAIAATGLRALNEGRLSPGLLSVVWLVVWTLPGVVAGHQIFTRHTLGDGGSGRGAAARPVALEPARARGAGRFDVTDLPLLPDEVLGMAAKELRYLLRSVVGKFNLLMTVVLVLIVVFVFTEALPREVILGIEPETITLFGMLAYMTLLSNNFVNNSFAWEGPGIKLYFYGPVSLHRVLMGKNVGVWVFAGACAALALTTWSAFHGPPDPLTLLSSLLVYACCTVSSTIVGNFVSILFPVRRDSSSILSSPAGPAVIIALVTLATVVSVVGLVAIAPVALGHAFLQPLALLALLAGLLLGYRWSLVPAAMLMRHRAESLIETLCAPG